MKKLIIFFLFAGIAVSAQDKSFEKNTKVISLGYNLGVYGTKSRDKHKGTSDRSEAASNIFHGQFEYGVLNFLGVGAKLQYGQYIVERDSATGLLPTAYSMDGFLVVNLHFVRAKYVDMLFGLNGGGSQFVYKLNDGHNTMAKGFGSSFDVHFQTRFYFGKYIGLNLNLAYANFNYPNLIASSDLANHTVNFASIKGNGINIGMALQVKF
jgi:hypothetical protein